MSVTKNRKNKKVIVVIMGTKQDRVMRIKWFAKLHQECSQTGGEQHQQKSICNFHQFSTAETDDDLFGPDVSSGCPFSQKLVCSGRTCTDVFLGEWLPHVCLGWAPHQSHVKGGRRLAVEPWWWESSASYRLKLRQQKLHSNLILAVAAAGSAAFPAAIWMTCSIFAV